MSKVTGDDSRRDTTGMLVQSGDDICLRKLDKFKVKISESQLFDEVYKSIAEVGIGRIRKIRCLALGSPTESNAALYQLVLVTELSQMLKVSANDISFYDPAFSSGDHELIESTLGYAVEEQFDGEPTSTLYFLPHASLSLTEATLMNEKPQFLLGNNLVTHTDRMSKRDLHQKYTTLALLVNLLARVDSKQAADEGFVTVKKKKRNKKNKNIYQEPEIDYDYASSFIQDIKATSITNTVGEWGNAFTDLCFHYIRHKSNLDS